MLGAIRNGYQTHLGDVVVPTSKKNLTILQVMYREGLIRGYAYNQYRTRVYLKYGPRPAISNIKIINRNVPTSVKILSKLVLSDAIYLINTTRGVLTLTEALRLNVGGSVICKIL